MKLFLTLALLILLTTCENDILYDGQSKYIIETKIVDKEGKPIANLPITINVKSEFQSDEISKTFTNINGSAIQFFPYPANNSSTASFIIGADTNYFPLYYQNIRKTNFIDYKLSFLNIVLYKPEEISNLQLSFNEISSNKKIENIKVEGKFIKEIIDFNQNDTFNPNPNYNYRVERNQTLILKYSIVDKGLPTFTITDYVKEIIIQDETVDYLITY